MITRSKSPSRRGFILIEVVVAMTILAAVLLPATYLYVDLLEATANANRVANEATATLEELHRAQAELIELRNQCDEYLAGLPYVPPESVPAMCSGNTP